VVWSMCYNQRGKGFLQRRAANAIGLIDRTPDTSVGFPFLPLWYEVGRIAPARMEKARVAGPDPPGDDLL